MTAPSVERAAEQAAHAQAVLLYQSGQRHNRDSRLQEAVDQLDRARKLAVAADARGLEEAARFWQGAALHGMGRLAEAFAVWAPALAGDTEGSLSDERYMILTRYLLAAIDLPLSLATIEQALDHVEARFESGAGGAGRRSRLLLARSRLALARGNAQDALALGLDALVRRKRESQTYTFSTHFRTTVRAALLAGQLDLVAELIEEWEAIEHAYPESKRLALTTARANLARYRGNPEEAVRLAERVVGDAMRSEEVYCAADAVVAFVRACLAAGVPDRARGALGHLARLRHAAIGELRFEVRLLLGDYHLTCLMLRTQGRARDVEFGTVGAATGITGELGAGAVAGVRDHPRCGDAAGWYAVRAARAYQAAEREGGRLDGLLATEHHVEVVAGRGTRLREASICAGTSLHWLVARAQRG